MKKYIENMGWLLLPDKVMKLDKQAHVFAGLYFAGLAFILSMALWSSKWLSFFIAVVFSAAVGWIKEYMDSQEKNNKFDNKDLIFTIIGGLLAAVLLVVIYQKP